MMNITRKDRMKNEDLRSFVNFKDVATTSGGRVFRMDLRKWTHGYTV